MGREIGTNTCYVKAVLYVFPHLKAFGEAVEASIKNKAALSFRKSDVFEAALPIVKEKFLLGAIGELQVDVLALLRTFSEEERYLLAYKYFRREEAFVPLSYCERSYYRKQKALLFKTAARLRRMGWTEERFMRAFGECAFFMKVLKALQEGKERELVKKRAQKTLLLYTKSSSSRLGAGDLRTKNTAAATATAATSATQTSAI